MYVEELKKLKSLSQSPELFEKKRQHLLDNFISSVTSKKEREKLRRIQQELDSNRDQSCFQLNIAKKILEQVTRKSRFLKEVISEHSKQQVAPTLIPFPNRTESKDHP